MKRVIALLSARTEVFNKAWLDRFKIEMLSTFRSHTSFICIILLYFTGYLIFSRIYGAADEVTLTLYYKNVLTLGLWCLLFFIIAHSIYVKLFIKPEYFMEYTINDLQTKYFTTERLCHLLLVFLLIPAFLSAFTSFKIILPLIHPFSWDLSLAKLDGFVHGGKQPWQLLQPIFGHPILTYILSFFYYLWFFVMYGVLCWQAFSLRNKQLRMQFFLTYLLSWIIIGTISAIIFSSAGPCYYEYVVDNGNNLFAPLMDYLYKANESFPLKSIGIQELLWSAYNGNETGLVKGISAMPSMHLSMSFIFVLLGWRVNRIAGICFSIFAMIIMIGSVHLGWHYAIDGYVAIIMTSLIWFTVGFFLKKTQPDSDFNNNN